MRLIKFLPGINGVVPEHVSDHGVATTMQVPGLHNNPLRVLSRHVVLEAADLLLLGVHQPADTVFRCMAINKRPVLIRHDDTMAVSLSDG